MSFNKWPKRSAEKNYFMVPNEIFSIGLDFREISIYSYLLRCENRETYQCYPSYKQRWQTPERKSALHRSPYPRCTRSIL